MNYEINPAILNGIAGLFFCLGLFKRWIARARGMLYNALDYAFIVKLIFKK